MGFRPWPRSTFLAVMSAGVADQFRTGTGAAESSLKSLIRTGGGSFFTYTMAKKASDNVNAEYRARRLLPDRIDYGILVSWLEYCKLHHTSHCSRSPGHVPPNLQFVDCTNDTIVGDRCYEPYVALSYVWGDVVANVESDTFPHLPSLVPNVVKDAIEVVKRLQMRYLWIDRYCIPQEPAEKHRQINDMDLIYRNAEVTIVAAAGKDPAFGLPGVGERQRLTQPAATVNDYCLVSTMTPPSVLIYASRWWERAWVLQEALLSRRRLIFTTEQVFFECQCMSCSEVLDEPLDFLHQNKSYMDSRYRTGLFPDEGVGKDPSDVAKLIEIYSEKKLTYESDGLNAIAGSLRLFSQQKPPVYTYWGVPFVADSPNSRTVNSSKTAFLRGLLWIIEGNYRRRQGHFPAWSWVGYIGRVSYERAEVWKWNFKPVHSRQLLRGEVDGWDEVSISVEMKDGEVLPWKSFIELGIAQMLPSTWSRYINIRAPTASFSILYVDEPGSVFGGNDTNKRKLSKYWVKVTKVNGVSFACSELQLNDDSHQTFQNDLDPYANSTLLQKAFECLILGRVPSEADTMVDGGVNKFASVILLGNLGDHYQRLGIFHIWPQKIIREDGKVMMDNTAHLSFKFRSSMYLQWKDIRLG